MQFEILRKKLQKLTVFDQNAIKLIDPNFNDKLLFDWQKKGLIKKIIRGKYIFTEKEYPDAGLYALAHELYQPSYISLEFALSSFGLIPETVHAVTSVSTRKTKDFYTDMSPFIYRHIKKELFFGYTVINHSGFTYKFAELEKALLDFLYLNASVKSQKNFIDMRLDLGLLKEELDKEKFKFYLEKFKNKSLEKRAQNLLKGIENA
jgi:predicted transcriptional regulator of viral defense system